MCLIGNTLSLFFRRVPARAAVVFVHQKPTDVNLWVRLRDTGPVVILQRVYLVPANVDYRPICILRVIAVL